MVYYKGIVDARQEHRHPLDHNLPGHWTGITAGQTTLERVIAIRANIRRDREQRGTTRYRRGYPVDGHAPETRMTGAQALAIAMRLKYRSL